MDTVRLRWILPLILWLNIRWLPFLQCLRSLNSISVESTSARAVFLGIGHHFNPEIRISVGWVDVDSSIMCVFFFLSSLLPAVLKLEHFYVKLKGFWLTQELLFIWSLGDYNCCYELDKCFNRHPLFLFRRNSQQVIVNCLVHYAKCWLMRFSSLYHRLEFLVNSS